MMTLIVLALATWRISSLLVSEEGPKHIFARLRDYVKSVSEHAYDGLTCYYCNSIWIGAAFAGVYIVNERLALYIALPFALATVAIFVSILEELCANAMRNGQAN